MPTSQSEKASRIGWADILALSFGGCLLLSLYSIIPLLTIIAGIFTLIKGLYFWGLIIIVLGVMALIGPLYAASRPEAGDEKLSEKTGNK